MPTLYFHVGIMKTGTSSIQKFLKTNNDALIKQGYVYPFTSMLVPSTYVNRNGHFLIYNNNREKTTNEKKKSIWESGWKVVTEYMKQGMNVIISDESIWYRQSWTVWNGGNFWECIKDIAREYNYDIKAVGYIRRQDLYLESYYNTAVRGDTLSKLDFDEYVREKKYEFCKIDYESQIKFMIEHLGKENVTIRPFERSQFGGKNKDLVSDFLMQIGVEFTNDFIEIDEPSNIAASGNYLEMKRLINQMEGYNNTNNFLRKSIDKASGTDAIYAQHPIKEGFFTYEGRLEFIDRYKEGNEWIAREILGREDGRLFYDEVKDLPKWQCPYDHSTEDIIRVMAEIAYTQQLQNQELKKQIQEVKKQIKELQKHRGLTGWIMHMFGKVVTKLRNKKK